VLFRTSSHSGPLEIELTRRNIPFVKFGGLKFLDAAHIKDMLALLRFVENPRDRVAGFRVMHLLPGIGSATAQRVLDRMAEAADPIAALARRHADAAARRRRLEGLRRDRGQSPIFGMACRSGAGPPLVRTASRTHP
jgi:superfamily I DNA/RNA helicase